MNIQQNVWYRFKNQKEAKQWLTQVHAQYADVLADTTFLSTRELLRIEPADNIPGKAFVIRYRTQYTEKYVDSFVWWEPWPQVNYTELMSNSVYGVLGKNDLKVKGEQNMNELINKAMHEQKEVVNKEFDVLRETYIKSTTAGKLIEKFVDDLNKQENVEAKFDNIFEMYMLSDKDNERLQAILEQEDKAVKEVLDKFKELKGLLNIAETYEQKEKLLKEYGVLRYSK